MIHFAPLLCLLLLFLIGALGRSLVQWRRYGTLGVVLTWREALVGFALAAALGAHASLAAVAPEALAQWTLPLPGPARAFGLVLVVAAVVFMVVAQLQLGASWRVGIDRSAKPGLVTRGYYRISRNPIFGFMLLALVGLTVLVPTVFAVAVLVLVTVVTRLHVIREEKWLADTYGDAYRTYASRVGRFTPWIGRL